MHGTLTQDRRMTGETRHSNLRAGRPALLLIVAATIYLPGLAFSAERVAPAGPGTAATPKGVSAADWSGIRAAYEANRHAAFAVAEGYVARNPGQRWNTRFDGRGFVTSPDGGGWTWGLELVSIGRGDSVRTLHRPTCVDAVGGRVEYEWDDALSEWFINDPRGLEHGFTLRRPPVDHSTPRRSPMDRPALSRSSKDHTASTGAAESELLRLTLAVRGDLRPSASPDGRNVAFVNAAGIAVVNYNGLTVLDANGVALPARFETTPTGLRLRVDDREARYPLTIDPVAQQAYIKASNTDADDSFGYSVAVSGDTIVVGAWLEDSPATGVNGNQFSNSCPESGAAYVFVRSNGIWAQQAYLKPSVTRHFQNFGYDVAIADDTIVVGSPEESSGATGVNGNQSDTSAPAAGAAYVFVRNGETWSQQAYLKAASTNELDRFGFSVAISGDTVLVGVRNEDSNATGVNGNPADNSLTQSGAAYLFVRDAGTWTQQAYLKASNSGGGDEFGYDVAISGDTVVVGAHNERSNATGINGNQNDDSFANAGAAYVFVRNGTTWSQQAYVKASNTNAQDAFAGGVAISGNTLVIGARFEDSNATGVNGNQADNSASGAGAAYVFVRNGTIWSQQAYLKASNTDPNDRFGMSVTTWGDRIAVGAWERSSATGVNGDQLDNSASNAGAVYLFERIGGAWSQQAYIKASNTQTSDLFGYTVGLTNDTLAVGAHGEESSATGVNGNQADNGADNSGAVYLFSIVPCPTLGDVNCDCAVDPLDVEAFVLALVDPAGYAVAYLTCDLLNGDMQPDGSVNGDDVQGFVDLLIP